MAKPHRSSYCDPLMKNGLVCGLLPISFVPFVHRQIKGVFVVCSKVKWGKEKKGGGEKDR